MKVELSIAELEVIDDALRHTKHHELGDRMHIRAHGYWKDDSDEYWYCEVHKRMATWMFQHPTGNPDFNPPRHTCDPNLGGITMPCRCVKVEHPIITKDGIKAK